MVPGGAIRGGVQLAGRQVRWVEAGTGQPTVVLDAGRNDSSITWAPVMTVLAARVRVVAYDRAGLGASDPARRPASLQRQITDLAAVIGHAARGPCVLAGHSWGGLLAQLLAFHHPGLVSGLVLVDPAHEEMTSRLPRPARWLARLTAGQLRATLLTVGLLQPVQRRQALRTAGRLTRDPQTRALLTSAYRACAGRPDELTGITASDPLLLQARTAPSPFPDVPVTILSATRGFPPQLRKHWTELQAGLAAHAPAGQHIIAADTGHAIHHDQPELVATAILDVITRITRGRRREEAAARSATPTPPSKGDDHRDHPAHTHPIRGC
jgi:pimeloyl-ACP methyl ester carboxylesterase